MSAYEVESTVLVTEDTIMRRKMVSALLVLVINDM